MLIELQVRRFRCGERACEQATFAEQVDGLTFRHGRRSAGLQAVQAQRLKAILARCPALDRTADHVRAFAELMNNRQGRDLSQWITGVQSDDLPALYTFVTGLGQDLDAVVAGLNLRYSSGAVEGHNNKIMLKRQMLGRANFDLLRNLAIGVLKTLGADNIAKTTRAIRDEPQRALPILGITNDPDTYGT
ncbi:transposase [Streptomyces sp. NBC_01314]|uniref:transposase n=1 Tax=Streptomyces sp. NBC_01314 TaxID=2903821 RepID=UPI0030858C00|nr:transposase [Streptomyces sp. NBC_01314]